MKNLLFILLFTVAFVTQAQYAYFPSQGTISYEKTVFLKNSLKRYAAYSKEEQSKGIFSQMSTQAKENQVLKKTLTFSGDEFLYEHVKEEYPEDVQQLMMMGIFESGISNYSNLKTKEFKSVFELAREDISVQDTISKIKWKITNEYREIAGYQCRRANGVALDSIYIVAFYTDAIPVSGGPSALHGLPGMILGAAVPELHYNIFATKVDLTPVALVKADLFKKKSKPSTRKDVYDKLNAVVGGYLGEKIFNLVMANYYL